MENNNEINTTVVKEVASTEDTLPTTPLEQGKTKEQKVSKRKYVMTEARKLAFQKCLDGKKKKSEEKVLSKKDEKENKNENENENKKESKHKRKIEKMMKPHYLSKIPFHVESSSSSSSSSFSSPSSSSDENSDSEASLPTVSSDEMNIEHQHKKMKENEKSKKYSKKQEKQRLFSKIHSLTKNTKRQFRELHKKMDIQQQQGKKEASSLLFPDSNQKEETQQLGKNERIESRSNTVSNSKQNFQATTNNFRFV
jgi:hypothetical protein